MAPQCGSTCMKPGRVTRNGYLNFLRDFRKTHCGLSAVETVRQGARAWKSLKMKEKSKYMEMAKRAPVEKRRMRMKASRRRGSRARSSRGHR